MYVYIAFHRQICSCYPCAAGWVRANSMLCRPGAWTDGFWWGQQFGLTPFDLHWAHLYLAHNRRGTRALVPPKHCQHVALVTPRASAVLHSLSGLNSSSLNRGCCGSILLTCQAASRMARATAFVTTHPELNGDDPQPPGHNSYNPGVSGQPQGWSQSSPEGLGLSMTFQWSHQNCVPAQFFQQLSFDLIFHSKVEQQSK